MARPPLPIGSWGEISTWAAETNDKGKATKYKSQARFRDYDGRVRPVSAFGKTRTAAQHAVLKKLQDRAKANRSGELSPVSRISVLIDLWDKRFEALVKDGRRSPTSLDTYRRAIKNHIRPALDEVRIGEATTPRIDTVIAPIKANAGTSTAKTCRSIISGVMKLAVRYGAISLNPVREVDTIEAPPKNPPRSLTDHEVALLRKHLATSDSAVRADLPDLVGFMLGTGVRIGEALLLTRSPQASASFPIHIRRFVPQVMPRISIPLDRASPPGCEPGTVDLLIRSRVHSVHHRPLSALAQTPIAQTGQCCPPRSMSAVSRPVSKPGEEAASG